MISQTALNTGGYYVWNGPKTENQNKAKDAKMSQVVIYSVDSRTQSKITDLSKYVYFEQGYRCSLGTTQPQVAKDTFTVYLMIKDVPGLHTNALMCVRCI